MGRGRKKTHDEYVKEVYNKVGDEYTVLGKYVGSADKILVRHNTCNHEWEVISTNILKGTRCPNCANKSRSSKKKLNTSDFTGQFKEFESKEYTLLSEYNGGTSKVSLIHNTCGYEYDVIARNFKRGDRCPKCSGNLKKNTSEISDIISNITDKECSLESEYKGYHNHVSIKHHLCGNVYDVKPANFISNNRRCPICKESKGEKCISEILNNLNVEFKRQFVFEDCKNKRRLPFDFAVFKNGELKFLIEFQGIQHYKENDFFGKENFEATKKNDEIKRNYCINNNIKLLVIPYWDYDNIEEILSESL